MAVPRGEIGESHLVGSADPCVQMVDLSSESIGRQPLGHCIGIEERPIDSFRLCAENAMEPDRIGSHDDFLVKFAKVIGIVCSSVSFVSMVLAFLGLRT